MNKHLTDGQLRAAIDGEAQLSEMEHLQICRDCQKREEALQNELSNVGQRLAFLAPKPQDAKIGRASCRERV
jgi:hypothetical protein